MDAVKEFTQKLVMGLVKNPDIVKVQDFEDEDGTIMLDIIIHHDDHLQSAYKLLEIICKWIFLFME